MYGVLRVYDNAMGLVDALLDRQDDVKSVLTAINGFQQWGMFRTATGGFTFTQCETAEACAESVTVAANWLKQNFADRNWPAPTVYQGDIILSASAGKPVATPPGRIFIFGEPGPPGGARRMDEIREVAASVPGYRSYTIMRTATGSVHGAVADDVASIDAIRDRLADWVKSNYPDFSRAAPQTIDGQAVARITAARVTA